MDNKVLFALGKCGELDALIARSFRGHVMIRDHGDLARFEVERSACIAAVFVCGSGETDIDGSTTGEVDLDFARSVIQTLDPSRITQVVVLSTAMVYGASDQFIERTELSPVATRLELPFASSKYALEQLCQQWGESHSVGVTVLRPCVVVHQSKSGVDWIERSLWSANAASYSDATPRRQFLLMSDLVSAIRHVADARTVGVFNVAPQGSLSEREQLELTGMVGRVRIPSEAAPGIERARYAMQLSSTPPEALAYALGSWVVDAQKLRDTGWQPGFSNEEAFVATTRATWWSSMSARRRQELSLAGLGAAAATAVGIGIALAKNRKRLL